MNSDAGKLCSFFLVLSRSERCREISTKKICTHFTTIHNCDNKNRNKVQVFISRAHISKLLLFDFFFFFKYVHVIRLLYMPGLQAAGWMLHTGLEQAIVQPPCFMLKTHSTKCYLSDIHRCKKKTNKKKPFFPRTNCIRAPRYWAHKHIKGCSKRDNWIFQQRFLLWGRVRSA